MQWTKLARPLNQGIVSYWQVMTRLYHRLMDWTHSLFNSTKGAVLVALKQLVLLIYMQTYIITYIIYMQTYKQIEYSDELISHSWVEIIDKIHILP